MGSWGSRATGELPLRQLVCPKGAGHCDPAILISGQVPEWRNTSKRGAEAHEQEAGGCRCPRHDMEERPRSEAPRARDPRS